MTELDLLDDVRRLRERGRSPKQIARVLGVRPAAVAPLVRRLAQERCAVEPVGEVVRCWVNRGWDEQLEVDGHPEWPRGTPSEGVAGLAYVVVARQRPRAAKARVCCYLVDTQCLGVKDTIGPRQVRLDRLDVFLDNAYGAYDAGRVEAPLELAQHLVLGAVEFARGLGFEPHPDFRPCAPHLGSWSGPSAIRFGRHGQPMYIAGPYDDPDRVLRTLERSVGEGSYGYIVGLPA